MTDPDLTLLPALHLLPGRDKRLRHGHPWVYSNELRMDEAAKALPPGSLAQLFGADGRSLGVAGFNPHTLIAARRFADAPDTAIDQAFLALRLEAALKLRNRLFSQPYYRLIHAESDRLPGLIIDRFGDTLVVQANTATADRLLPELLAALDAVVAPAAVLLRNDTAARTQEGLPEEIRIAKGNPGSPLALEENGCRFLVDPAGGQKTGWFYDQREHRAFVAALSPGARVIDLYSYVGSFGLQCARAGASAVDLIDRSQPALDLAAQAAAANGVSERCQFRRVDAFAELERLAAARISYDVVIADPPAFVKSKKDVAVGSRAYRKLARLAARITAPRGVLLMASCSHNIEPGRFAEEVANGLQDAGRTGRILRSGGAGPDHPVHPLLPETAYLKVQILQLD